MWQQKIINDETVGIGVSAVVFEKGKVLCSLKEKIWIIGLSPEENYC